MIVSVTGHRPEDLPNVEWVYEALKKVIVDNNVELLVQGMAAGVDLMSADACIELGVPFVSARPWATHTPRKDDREQYQRALDKAVEVVNVDPATEYVGPWLYHNRNEYMVDRAETVIAVWTGKTSGGTYACVRYAKRQKKPIIQINPVTQEIIYPKMKPEEPHQTQETLFDV